MKILIIDDDQHVANLLSHYLKSGGHGVACAGNGRDGLEMAIAAPVELIILDRGLPENIDGIYLLKILRADNNQTPVLIISGHATLLDQIEGFRAGTDDYLSKPFSLMELDKRIEAIATKHRALAALPAGSA